MKMSREELDEIYLQALKHQENGDVEAALELFMKGATLGDAGAQHAVGLAYDFGTGIEPDKVTALHWYKKAWQTSHDTNYIDAIALTYVEIGQVRNAIYWWEKAIGLNDGSTALTYAKFLMEGKQSRNIEKVKSLLKMAIDSHAPVQISESEREEAHELLNVLVGNNGDAVPK